MVRTRSFVRFGSPLAIALVAFAGTQAHAQTFNWNNFAGTTGGGTLTWTDSPTGRPRRHLTRTLSCPSAVPISRSRHGTPLNSDQLTANVNGLLFNFEGGSQASFVSGGTPYLINLGNGPNFSGLHMNPSSTAVAPSIIQNGSGAVAIRTNVDPTR